MIRDVAMSESHSAITPQLQVYGIFILIYFLKRQKRLGNKKCSRQRLLNKKCFDKSVSKLCSFTVFVIWFSVAVLV